MNKSAIIYIGNSDQTYQADRLKTIYGDSDIYTSFAGSGREISLQALVGDRYYDYVFCLTPDEMQLFFALKAVLFYLEQYSSVAVITDDILWPVLPGSKNTACIFPYVLDEKYTGIPADMNLGNQPLYHNAAFAISGGDDTLHFLKWCAKKYEQILFSGMGERGFLKTWLSYVSLFGCKVQIEKKAVESHTIQEKTSSCFSDGTPIADILRGYYGKDYRLREKCGRNPFAHPDYFIHDSVILGDTQILPLTAAEKAIYQSRTDLQAVFPNLMDEASRVHFTEWFLEHAQDEFRLPDAYLQTPKKAYEEYQKAVEETARQKSKRRGFSLVKKKNMEQAPQKTDVVGKYPFGVNLCGFVKGNFGLGESCRILARILSKAQIPFTVVDVQLPGLHTFTNEEFDNKISNTFPYHTNLFAYNPDCFEETVREFDRSVFAGRRNIGYWAWEMPEFPDGWESAFPYFDEIWTLSDFTTQSIAQKSPIPVYTVPYAIDPQKDDSLSRKDFGLPEDKFIFVMTYDTRSISERKNPAGAVRAFQQAFGNRTDVCLLLKLNTPLNWNGDQELMKLIHGSENIFSISRQMSKQEINSLISLCDAYVSLHRSEGFGLGPAEAMAFGRPAVITAYSGNMQYMRDDACCPVPYTLTEVKKDYGIYKKGMHWAQPDEAAAAVFLKRLVDDKDYYNKISLNAKKVIETEFSYGQCGKNMMERLKSLRK